jgi:hypothetical protein
MSLTIDDAIEQAREVIQDTHVPYRHSDAKLVSYLNDALLDVRRLRPDLFIGALTTDPVLYTTADLGISTAFPIDGTYFTTVADYLSLRVGLGDDEFVADGRAAALHQMFITRLVGKFS